VWSRSGLATQWRDEALSSGFVADEANRNLVLSDGARADSIPNLEIETGEIEGAGHASATGRLDDEHLFYLQSRGISENEARRLVALGFLLDVIGKIKVPELEERLTDRIAVSLDSLEATR
jgi:Fe-S cluster assembly protein SufD